AAAGSVTQSAASRSPEAPAASTEPAAQPTTPTPSTTAPATAISRAWNRLPCCPMGSSGATPLGGWPCSRGEALYRNSDLATRAPLGWAVYFVPPPSGSFDHDVTASDMVRHGEPGDPVCVANPSHCT